MRWLCALTWASDRTGLIVEYGTGVGAGWAVLDVVVVIRERMRGGGMAVIFKEEVMVRLWVDNHMCSSKLDRDDQLSLC